MSSTFPLLFLMPILYFLMGLVLPAFALAAGIQLRGLMPGRVVYAFFFWAAAAIMAHIPHLIMGIRAMRNAVADEIAVWSAISSLMSMLTTLASVWLGFALLAVVRRLRDLAMLDPGGPMDRAG
jgi:hypothetical protein